IAGLAGRERGRRSGDAALSQGSDVQLHRRADQSLHRHAQPYGDRQTERRNATPPQERDDTRDRRGVKTVFENYEALVDELRSLLEAFFAEHATVRWSDPVSTSMVLQAMSPIVLLMPTRSLTVGSGLGTKG